MDGYKIKNHLIPEGKRSFGEKIKKHRLPHVLINIENGTTISRLEELEKDAFTAVEIGMDIVHEEVQQVEKDENKIKNVKKKEQKAKRSDNEIITKLKQ